MVRDAVPLLFAVLLALAAILQPPFVGTAQQQARDVTKSAFATYAALRAINATISTVKETEISVPLVGGLGAKPGMALDPIDETVARVADILFLLMAVTAVLSIAFAPIATAGAAIAAAGFLGLWLVRRYPSIAAGGVLAQRAALFGLLFAIVLPASLAGGGWIAAEITGDQLDAALLNLRSAGGESVPTMDAAPAAAPWWSFWSAVDGEAPEVAADGGWRSVIGEYSARAETILASSLDIIAVYLLRLFVVPAFALAILLVILRQALRLFDGRPPG